MRLTLKWLRLTEPELGQLNSSAAYGRTHSALSKTARTWGLTVKRVCDDQSAPVSFRQWEETRAPGRNPTLPLGEGAHFQV